MMDSDGDGELTASEIYNALVKLGMPQTIDYVRDIVEKADEDGNGTVSRGESISMRLQPISYQRAGTGSGRRVNSGSMTYLLINTLFFVLQDHLNI